MGLKNLLRRASGLITAFALLASMMVVAGAAPTVTSANCVLCGKELGLVQVDGKTYTSYQEKYSVDTIPNLTNAEDWSYDEQNCAAMYNDKYICVSCLEEKIAEYKAANSGTISSPGTGKTPVTLTAAASTFNVTVPTSIPLVVGADSKVTSPSDV